MLTLTRKEKESIVLKVRDEVIMVWVRRICGQQVTLSMQANQSCQILRGELYRSSHDFEIICANRCRSCAAKKSES